MFRFGRYIAVLLNKLRSFNPPEDSSEDPFAGVREPRRRSPTGRSFAVALAEPPASQDVRAVGTDAGERSNDGR